jgi:hypothetical protein
MFLSSGNSQCVVGEVDRLERRLTKIVTIHFANLSQIVNIPVFKNTKYSQNIW